MESSILDCLGFPYRGRSVGFPLKRQMLILTIKLDFGSNEPYFKRQEEYKKQSAEKLKRGGKCSLVSYSDLQQQSWSKLLRHQRNS